jgi:hypothetical protein
MEVLANAIMPKVETISSEKKMYYEFKYIESVSNISIYNQFLNWVSGEFVLCLQERENGLKVYFPSGLLSIKLLENSYDEVGFEITIKAKNKQKAINTRNTVYNVLSHLREFY